MSFSVRTFLPDPVSPEVIQRVLKAAHHAPSVGFMQPLNFIMVSSDEIKERLAWVAEKERKALAIYYEDERKTKFLELSKV